MTRLQVGYCGPRLIVLVALMDVLLRLAPAGWRLYAPGERQVSRRVLGDAFERNLTLHEAGFGDLMRIANLRDGQEWRPMTFTTDASGFRSKPVEGPSAGIVFGDSFAYSGDNDEEALAAQLGRRVGCGVYNGAGPVPEFETPSAREVKSVTTRLGIQRGVVIVERVERLLVDRSYLAEANERDARAERMDWATRHVPGFDRLMVSADWLKRAYRTSSVELAADETVRSLKNGKVLPNSFAGNVTPVALLNGDRMLFYPGEFRTYERSWPLRTEYWVQLDQDLKKEGVQLLVVLVPNKFTVYHRLLATAPSVAVQPGELLSRLETDLRARGIPAVDVTPALQAEAAKEYAQGRYIYWREDTHWKARAVDVAAAEVERALRRLPPLCH